MMKIASNELSSINLMEIIFNRWKLLLISELLVSELISFELFCLKDRFGRFR